MSVANRLAKFAQFLVAKDWDGGDTPPGDIGLSGVSVVTFTSSGTYTPTAGMRYCRIRVQAPGGGSGGADGVGTVNSSVSSGGGGGGEYAEGIFTADQIGESQPVTIGSPGAAGSNTGGNGGAGGTTSVGSLISAVGGGGGEGTGSNSENSDDRDGGAGGTGGSGGYLHIPGQPGEHSSWITDDTDFGMTRPGSGGSRIWDMGHRPRHGAMTMRTL